MKDEYHVSYQWDMRDRSLLKQQLMRWYVDVSENSGTPKSSHFL